MKVLYVDVTIFINSIGREEAKGTEMRLQEDFLTMINKGQENIELMRASKGKGF